MSFKSLEDRVNAAVLSNLSNATANINGQVVDVIFDHEYSENLGIAGRFPVIQIDAAVVNGLDEGQELLIDLTRYKFKNLEPDGTGFVRVELHKVP